MEKVHQKRILVADNELDILLLIEKNLVRQGHVVETARDGVKAREKLRTNKPDLRISGTMMPEMNGFELLSILRADPEFTALPVLLLTARPKE